MSKRKIAMMVFSSILTSNILPSMTASVDECSNDEVLRVKKQKNNVIISKADFTNRRNYERCEDSFKIEEVINFPGNERTYKISILEEENNVGESIYVGVGKYKYNEVTFTYEDGEIDKISIIDTEESPYNGYIYKCLLYSSLTDVEEKFEILGVDKHIYINIGFTIIKVGLDDIKVYDKEIIDEESITLDKVIEVSDVYLRKAIKNNLDILSNDITLGDMYKLKELCDFSGKVSDLKDLTIAKNLEKITLNYSPIKDLSPLKDLKNLREISIVGGLIKAKPVCNCCDYIEGIEKIISINGERIFPKEVIVEYDNLVERINIESDTYIEEIMLERGLMGENVRSVLTRYKDNDVNFQTQVFYKINDR